MLDNMTDHGRGDAGNVQLRQNKGSERPNLQQFAKVARGTDKKTDSKAAGDDTQSTGHAHTDTHGHTQQGFCMPGVTPSSPRDRVILTLLGGIVGVRLVVCSGWGIGRLLVTPLAN